MKTIIILSAAIMFSGLFGWAAAADGDNMSTNLKSTDLAATIEQVNHRVVRSIHSPDKMYSIPNSPQKKINNGIYRSPARDEIEVIGYENQDELDFFITIPNDFEDFGYNVRFTPAEDVFNVVGLEIVLFDMDGDAGNPGLEVTISSSENDLPNEEMVTFEVNNQNLEFSEAEDMIWNEIWLEDFNADIVGFNQGEEFHIIVNVIINDEEDTLAIIMDRGNQPTDRSGLWSGPDEEWFILEDLDGFIGYNFAIHAIVEYPELGIVINEFMADNADFIQDPQDEFEDWIELFNPNIDDVALDGMFLTNNLDEEEMWEFPEGTVIEAGGYLLIWADGDVDDDGLHTSFTLDAEGGEIGFFAIEDDELIRLDVIEFEEQIENWSMGRREDGAEKWIHSMNPTPGEQNVLPNGPVLMVDPIRLEFPLTEINGVSELELTVTNQGDMILEISYISIEDEYFSTPLEDLDEVFTVIPGDTIGLSVPVFFSPEEVGDFRGLMIIDSNDPENPEYDILLTGTGAVYMIELSTEMIDFGDVESDDAVGRPLIIKNISESDLTIAGIEIDNEVFLSSFDNEVTIAPADSLVLSVIFQSLVNGDFAGRLTIESNDLFNPELTVEIQASRRGSFVENDRQKTIPTKISLSSVYPNPFNARLHIPFGLPNQTTVSINIYDVAGSLIKVVINESLQAGNHIYSWNAESVSPGIYFVRMNTGEFMDVRKIVLVK